MSLPPLRLLFLRHARPLVPEGYAYGSMENVLLNMTGPQTQAAFEAIASLLPKKFHAVSSPSPRARAAVEHIQSLKNLPKDAYEIDPRFHEQNWGDWERKFYKDIPAAELAHYHENPDEHHPPNGESLNQTLTRVSAGMDDLIRRYEIGEIKHPDILVSGHGGVIRSALAYAENKPVSAFLKQPVRRLSVTIIERDLQTAQWRVPARNLTIHPP